MVLTAQFTLSVAKSSTGNGQVIANVGAIDCGGTCSAIYTLDTVVTLAATPDSNSTFEGWSGAGCSGTGTCAVTVDATKSVTAIFTLIPYALSVNMIGTGAGTVLADAGDIACGVSGGACSAIYGSGTVVTLTAAPDDCSTFAGWTGGGCSGTGACGRP